MSATIEARPDSAPELEALGDTAELEALPYAEASFEALGPVVTMEQIE